MTVQTMSDTTRLRGIVDRMPPGRTGTPNVVDVRIGASDPMVAHELRETRRNIERRRESGELSRREARRLRQEANLVGRLTVRYGTDGLSTAERGELMLRANALRSRSERPTVTPVASAPASR